MSHDHYELDDIIHPLAALPEKAKLALLPFSDELREFCRAVDAFIAEKTEHNKVHVFNRYSMLLDASDSHARTPFMQAVLSIVTDAMDAVNAAHEARHEAVATAVQNILLIFQHI